MDSIVRLVAFDLDGTLLRGDTVCQAIARQMGHLERMNEFEQLQQLEAIAAAREELATYYRSILPEELVSHLDNCVLAPGVRDGFSHLKAHGIAIAIVSITWTFGVEWFARLLGADFWVGTELLETGEINHFWPSDKPIWLTNLMNELGLTSGQVAAVGDSPGDIAMLQSVNHSYYVGSEKPVGLNARHVPNGDILTITREILAIT